MWDRKRRSETTATIAIKKMAPPEGMGGAVRPSAEPLTLEGRVTTNAAVEGNIQ